MSKAKPMAYIYEKWLQGIVKAVPNPAERCALLEYICRYQFAQIYGSEEMPSNAALSQAASVALCLLEGDLQDMSDARKDNNRARAENGRNIPKQTQADPSRGGQTLSSQVKSNTSQYIPPIIPPVNCGGLDGDLFLLGLDILDKGRKVSAVELVRVWNVAKDLQTACKLKKSKRDYVAGCFKEELPKEETHAIANLLRATGVRSYPALECYGLQVIDGTCTITCSRAAADSIEAEMTDKMQVWQDTLRAMGATKLDYNIKD